MRWTLLLILAAQLVAAPTLQADEPAGAGAALPGQALFEQKCTACHTVGGGVRIGPDLQGVTERRPPEWIYRQITAPETLLAEKDPVATALLKQYNQIPMPNLAITEGEARQLIEYLGSAAAPAAAAAPAPQPMSQPAIAPVQGNILKLFLAFTIVIALVFLWIGLSTSSPADVDVKRAYVLRRVFFVGGVTVVIVLLAMTFPHVPYAATSTRADKVIYVAARQYEFLFTEEPVTSTEDLGRVTRISPLEIPAGTLVEFRVTSLDVNHGFGLYGPDRQVIAQTQAMPGYFNRLLVRLDQPAQYKVFCLEYCATGHHLMQSHLTVK
ncbi:MAG: c-type cytochrome [Gammaproteobacteria bacterium]|nr:c-type cytochrome [Gammaproteobacteria bacterium]